MIKGRYVQLKKNSKAYEREEYNRHYIGEVIPFLGDPNSYFNIKVKWPNGGQGHYNKKDLEVPEDLSVGTYSDNMAKQ